MRLADALARAFDEAMPRQAGDFRAQPARRSRSTPAHMSIVTTSARQRNPRTLQAPYNLCFTHILSKLCWALQHQSPEERRANNSSGNARLARRPTGPFAIDVLEGATHHLLFGTPSLSCTTRGGRRASDGRDRQSTNTTVLKQLFGKFCHSPQATTGSGEHSTRGGTRRDRTPHTPAPEQPPQRARNAASGAGARRPSAIHPCCE